MTKTHKNNFLQKIFSVRNIENKKVLTLFGIKFKFHSAKRENLYLKNQIEYLKNQIEYLKNQERNANENIQKISNNQKKDADNLKQIIYNVSKGLMCFNNKHECDLCGSKNLVALGKNPDFNQTVIVKCDNCGFIYSILPENFDLGDYYSAEYRDKRKETPTEQYIKNQDARAKAQYDFIKKNIGEIKNKKILEIGCSIGSLLKLEEDKTNVLKGYEPDLIMSDYASKRVKGEVLSKMCDLNAIEDESYDLVQLSHVFEHFESPIYTIKELERITKTNGYIFIEVPNTNIDYVCQRSLNEKGIAHFSYFNTNSFKLLIEKHTGLKILDLKTFSFSIEDLLNNNVDWNNIAFDKIIPSDNSGGGIFLRSILKKP